MPFWFLTYVTFSVPLANLLVTFLFFEKERFFVAVFEKISSKTVALPNNLSFSSIKNTKKSSIKAQ